MAKTRAGRRDRAQNLGLKVSGYGSKTSLARFVAWFVVASTPLAFLPGTFLSHDVMPKVVLVLGGAAFLLMLIRQWTDGLARLWATTNGRAFLCLLGAQAVTLTMSTLNSRQPLLSFAGTTWRRFGMVEQLALLVIAMAVAALAVMNFEAVPFLWRATVACAGVLSIYGIAQYFGFDPFLERRLYALDYLGGIVRPPATMGHAIYFAAYLAPVALVAAWQATQETERAWRALQGVVAVLAPIAILLSGSRGALLGLLGGALVLFIQRRPTRKQTGVGLSAIGAVALFVAFAPAGANVRHRIEQWRGDPGSVRMAVWRESPGLFVKSPLLGAGPETFAGAFRQVQSAAISRAYPDFINETPHNIFIDAASEEGLAGFIILCGFFALAITAATSPGMRAATVAVLICGMFASFSLVSAMFLWVMAAIAAAHDPAGLRSRAVIRHFTWLAYPLAVLMIIVAAVLAVQDAAYADLGRAVEANDLTASRRALVRATSFGFGMPGYELWGSQELARLKAWDDALQASALAEKRGEDRASAAYQSSILRIVMSDAAGAEAKAREAILLAPNWHKPHLLRAQILQAMGRNAEAAREQQLVK